MTPSSIILPRVLCLKDAPRYLGVNIHRFKADVRPYAPDGWVAFDRQYFLIQECGLSGVFLD